MAKWLFFLVVLVSIWACVSVKNIETPPGAEIELVADSTEYELLVFDPGFEVFLAAQLSKDFYSDSYYKHWNTMYCVEWNIRHSNPMRYGDFYETDIPYDASIDYGIDFNYKLYQYFQFIEKEYGIVLISRKGKPIR